jgi:branched-chain amino acid transport system permease protein
MAENSLAIERLIGKVKENPAASLVILGSLALAVWIGIDAGSAQIVNTIITGGMWALLAVGLALVFGVANISYFAHGESFMVGAYVAFFVYNPIHKYLLDNPNPFLSVVAPLIAMLAAGLAGILLGMFIERLLFYPLRQKTQAGEWVMNAFLLTLGISFILSNGATLVLGTNFRGIPYYWDVEPLVIIGVRVPVDRVIAFLIAMLTIGFVWFFLRRTRTGRAIRAVAQDEIGAQMVGIHLDYIYTITMALSMFTATLAGASLLSIFQAYPTVGGIPLYFAWYVVILAGLGNVAGAIAGGFIVSLLQTATQQYIGIGWANVVPIGAMIIVLIALPSGIFGSKVKGIQER